MKVVILAGGRGTRLDHDRPKPMVEIGGIPMLSHIMGIYERQGFGEFVVATGYRGNIIRDFYRYHTNVTCLDTGEEAGTGTRVRLCADYIGYEDFLLTYGDGLADINLYALLNKAQNSTGEFCTTITAVHPPARFGQLVLLDDTVMQFNEKPIGQMEWINGGFFFVEHHFAQVDWGPSWETDALPEAARDGRLWAYRHEGFWQCMDTQRDLDYLNKLWQEGAPWLK